MAIDLYLHFVQNHTGQTDTVTVTVGRIGGTRTATHRFPLVRVRRIETSTTNVPIGFTQSELHNAFAEMLSGMFSGPGSSISFDGHTAYYDSNTLAVTINDRVSVGFYVSAPNETCQPRAYVYGSFILVIDNGALKVHWTFPPLAQFSYSTGCTIVGGLPIVSSLREWVEGAANDALRAAMEAKVQAAITARAPAGVFFYDTHADDGLLEVFVRTSSPVIEIAPAYDTFAAANVTGVLFPAGDSIGLLGTGIGVEQYFNTTPIHTVYAGPNGVPRTGTTSYANAHTLPRTSLVWNGKPVGALLVRTLRSALEDPTIHLYRPGCSIRIPTYNQFVRFGANDTPGVVGFTAQDIRIAFYTAGGVGQDACEQKPTDEIIFQ